MEKHDDLRHTLEVHRKEWREFSRQWRAQLASIRSAHQSMRNAMAPALGTPGALNPTLEPLRDMRKQLGDHLRRIRIPRQDVTTNFSSILSKATDWIKDIVEPLGVALNSVVESFKGLPPRVQEAVIALGKHGWYPDMQMPIQGLCEFGEFIKRGLATEVEADLCEYFDGRVAEIEESLLSRFPARGHLIRSAFGAHKRGEYELSIPVLLAQVDGICKDGMNEYLFMSRDKKPKTASYAERMAVDAWTSALLRPLASILPINASQGERPKGSDGLNRHMVLHGESLTYGNKSNSLKTISLINYVADMLHQPDRPTSS